MVAEAQHIIHMHDLSYHLVLGRQEDVFLFFLSLSQKARVDRLHLRFLRPLELLS